jgi:hypothetical protein
MTDRHTPGPWSADDLSDKVWATDEKGTFPVCDMRGWGHWTGKGHGALGLSVKDAALIQSANARLIAAAPELLAALKGVVAVANRRTVEFDAAHAAIVKATQDPGAK